MPPTTLVTFLFESAPPARMIELLGSWDNFYKPYPMKLDLRKGENFWSGCYRFEDIICDGDVSHAGLRRNGALKMGGTYWYYYRIDGHAECHDPSQVSTTFCPLLPGQRLNVLEVPYDSRSRSNSASSTSSGIHTLNPEDKYLNPRPAPHPLPKAITPSYGLEDDRKRSHLEMKSVATNSRDCPRSAGYEPLRRFGDRSPLSRHAKSVTSSHSENLKTTLFDFKEASERIKATLEGVNFGKLTSLEEERGRSRHARGARELQIGRPVLVDSLEKRRDLVLFTGASEMPPELPVTLNALPGRFSPLRCHPVDPSHDFRFSHMYTETSEPPQKRARSQVQYSPPPSRERHQLRGRAFSEEHRGSKSPRRVRHSRESIETIYRRRSMSVGKVREPSPLRNPVVFGEPLLIPDQIQEAKNEDDSNLQTLDVKWTSFLAAPARHNSRPASRCGESPEQFTQGIPSIDKDLPELPSYLLPDPLFFQSTTLADPDESRECGEPMTGTEPISHFSQWSTISIEFPSLSSDGEGVHSPTFSSITTSSDIETPQSLSDQYMGDSSIFYDVGLSDAGNAGSIHTSPRDSVTRAPHDAFMDCITPKDSSLIPEFLRCDIPGPESARHRHAACFGLSDSSQGYALSENQTTSQATLTKTATTQSPHVDPAAPGTDQSLRADPAISQLEQLMKDFGYLGEAVL